MRVENLVFTLRNIRSRLFISFFKLCPKNGYRIYGV